MRWCDGIFSFSGTNEKLGNSPSHCIKKVYLKNLYRGNSSSTCLWWLRLLWGDSHTTPIHPQVIIFQVHVVLPQWSQLGVRSLFNWAELVSISMHICFSHIRDRMPRPINQSFVGLNERAIWINCTVFLSSALDALAPCLPQRNGHQEKKCSETGLFCLDSIPLILTRLTSNTCSFGDAKEGMTQRTDCGEVETPLQPGADGNYKTGVEKL